MSKRSSLKNRLTLSASLLALPIGAGGALAPGSAQAQDSDTIIVTATRRNESLQDIPLNVAAVGGDRILRQGFDDISELAAYVPGINIVDQGGRDGNRIVARGLNVEPIVNAFGQPDGGGTVATYVGEIPLFVDLRLNDLERVEVLLGPQGTLFGAGTLGGAVRYIPVKPRFDQFELSQRLDGYLYDEGDGLSTDIGATVNIPISQNLALRGSIDWLRDKGFVDYPFIVQQPGVSDPDGFADSSNFAPLDDANTEEALSGRIALRWQPTDRLDGTFTYYFQNAENGGRTVSGIRGTLNTDEYVAPFRVAEPNERDNHLLALEVIADLDFAQLTSATGYAKTTEDGQRDQTDLLITLEYSYETFPTFTAFTFEDDETKIFNQELRLVSTTDSRLSWILGGYFNRNEYRALSSEFTPGYGAFAGLRTDLNDLEYFEVDRTETREYAFYGELGFDLTDALNITGGVRFYDFKIRTGNATFFPYFEGPDFAPYPLGQIDANLPLDIEFNDDGVLFKANASYNFQGGGLVYATFSQGYRAGGSNGGQPCPDVFVPGPQGLCLLAPGQQFGPNTGDVATINELDFGSDEINNYELGYKSEWLDGALRFNGSVYYIDWKNPQVAATSINAGTAITVNAGSARSIGVDVDGSWQVTDRFDIRGSYSYVNAELSEGVAGLIRTISPPGFGTVEVDAQDGDRLPGSPEHQFSVFTTYAHPLGNGSELALDFGVTHQSDVLSVVGGRGGFITLPSFTRANAALTYRRDALTVQLYSENLFNDFSESSVFNNPLYNQTISGANVRYFRTNVLAPRSVGLRFRYDFVK